MTRLLIALAPLLLAACNEAEEATPITLDADTGNGAAAAMMDKDGRVLIDTPVFKGEVQLPKMAIDAANMDIDGLKLFPGAKVAGLDVRGRKAGDGGSGVEIRFDAPEQVAVVRDWFIGEGRRAGFDFRTEGGSLVGTSGKGEPVRIDLADAANGHTSGVITVTSRR